MKKTDWLSPVEQLSPFTASRLRFLFSKTGLAVLVALFVLGLAAQARAQEPGPNILTPAQVQNSADAALYDANLRLAVAKQQLSALTGLNLGELDAVLAGVKPRP